MSTILQEQEWSVSVVSRMVFVGMCIDERACDEGHATISKSIRCLEEIVDELVLDDMISFSLTHDLAGRLARPSRRRAHFLVLRVPFIRFCFGDSCDTCG